MYISRRSSTEYNQIAGSGSSFFIEDCCCAMLGRHSRCFSHFTKEWPMCGCCASYPVPQAECVFARRCQLTHNCNKSYVDPAGAARKGGCGVGHESGAAGDICIYTRIYKHICIHLYMCICTYTYASDIYIYIYIYMSSRVW